LLFRCVAQYDQPGCQIKKGDALIYLVRAKALPRVGEVIMFETDRLGLGGKPRLACGKVVAVSEGIPQVEVCSLDEGKAIVTLLDSSALRGPVISIVRPLD
jgi:hypothetical protein